MTYDYYKLSSDAVSMTQDFFLHDAPNNKGFGSSMQIGVMFYKFIAKVLDESLKKFSSAGVYEREKEKLYSMLEKRFGLYSGVLENDLSIFSLPRIKEALYDYTDEEFHKIVDKWCKKAIDTFSDAFSNE